MFTDNGADSVETPASSPRAASAPPGHPSNGAGLGGSGWGGVSWANAFNLSGSITFDPPGGGIFFDGKRATPLPYRATPR